jgi:hypothetical protein
VLDKVMGMIDRVLIVARSHLAYTESPLERVEQGTLILLMADRDARVRRAQNEAAEARKHPRNSVRLRPSSEKPQPEKSLADRVAEF